MRYLIIIGYLLNFIISSQAMDYYNTTNYFPKTKGNLTAITWAHAVNSDMELNIALIDDDIMMIEADIVLGVLTEQGTENSNKKPMEMPIMAHPPENKSDLNLEMFLQEVIKHNSIAEKNKKGIKLDFKTIQVFQASVPILKAYYSQIKFPVWLNADILKGPGIKNDQVIPVDPKKFLDGCSNFPSFVLSLGWTTKYGSNKEVVAYTDQDIFDILDELLEVKSLITFPVRAGIAANSIEVLKHLIDEDDKYTLTIWSSVGDYVNVPRLKNLISTIGENRTYVDLPKKLRDEIGGNGNSGSSKLFRGFGIVGAAIFAAAMFYMSNRLSME